MDRYTKNSLWIYLKRGDDEEVLTDDELSNLEEKNVNEENEIIELFRIEIDLFHFNTPLCKAFKEFNYLVQIDVDTLVGLWTLDGTCEGIEHVCKLFRFKNRQVKWPTCNWKKDGCCNGGDLPGMTRIGNMIYFEDYEWYEELEDDELKDKALTNKAIFEGLMESMEDKDDDIEDLGEYLIPNEDPYYVNEEEGRSKERRCKLLGIPYKKQPTCKSEKFEVIKYSFGPTEE
ncbi:hypothetical protein Tco_1062220 [Tanacetum coccineum]